MNEDTGGQLPFEGSAEIAGIIAGIIERHCIETFVETGTQRGVTAKWAWDNFPYLYIVTIELNEEYFMEAFRRLAPTNVTQMIGHSADNLRRIRFNLHERVLFFLDAHGCGTDRTPLIEELEAIRDLMLRDAIKPAIAIHDFQVPDHPELGFDSYPEQTINLEFIAPQLKRMGMDKWPVRFNTKSDGAARGLCYILPP